MIFHRIFFKLEIDTHLNDVVNIFYIIVNIMSIDAYFIFSTRLIYMSSIFQTVIFYIL